MKKTKTLIQKVSLLPVEENKKELVYQFIYNYRYAYYATSNHFMGQIGTEFYNNGCSIDIEKFKNENKEIFSYDNPILKEITYPEGTDILPLCIRRVEEDFEKLLKNGLAYGKITLRNYKRQSPVPVVSRDIHFDIELSEHKNGSPNFSSLKAVFTWVNGMKFDVLFEANPYGFNLRKTFAKIKSGEYTVEDSLINIEKKKVGKKTGKKTINGIVLTLKMSIPVEEHHLDENTVVGVNLGYENTIVCGLNTDNYKREYIEPANVIKDKEQREYNARKSIEKSLAKELTRHERANKERAIHRLDISNRKMTKRINDKATTFIVMFARRNNAKYIQIEDMRWYGERMKNNLLIMKGNYNEFEEMLIRKARKWGMEVRKVNPYGNMQTCSFCGCQEDGQLISNKRFLCKNPECVSHTFKRGDEDVKYIEPDFNAARNIAKSYPLKSRTTKTST